MSLPMSDAISGARSALEGLQTAVQMGCTNVEHDHVTPYHDAILRQATERIRNFAHVALDVLPVPDTEYARGGQAMAKMLADMLDPDRP